MLKAAMFSREMARVFLVPDTRNGTPADLQQVSHVTKPDVLDRKRLKLVGLKKGSFAVPSLISRSCTDFK